MKLIYSIKTFNLIIKIVKLIVQNKLLNKIIRDRVVVQENNYTI